MSETVKPPHDRSEDPVLEWQLYRHQRLIFMEFWSEYSSVYILSEEYELNALLCVQRLKHMHILMKLYAFIPGYGAQSVILGTVHERVLSRYCFTSKES